MSEKTIECGNIIHNSLTYEVLWEPKTGTVWTKNSKGTKTNYGEGKANSKETAIECAKEMLRSSGI